MMSSAAKAASAPYGYPGTARLALTLAGVSGFVDAVGATYIAGIFVSFMSGNTTSTGLAVGQGQWDKALHAFLPIPLYVLGVFIGSLILVPTARRRPWVYALTALLLAGFVALALRADVKTGWFETLGVALLVLPMGTMNATLRKVGGFSVGLGYITGTLASLGENLARWSAGANKPGQSEGIWLYAGLWGCFFAGACLGSFGTHRFAAWALILPIVVLLTVMLSPAVHSPDRPADL